MAVPRGSVRLFKKVETFVRRHPDKAAKYLGVSESYAHRIQVHVAAGRPIGRIVKTQRGLDRWENRLKEARRLARAEKTAQSIQQAGLKSADIAEAAKRDPKEVYRTLRRMKQGKPVDPKLARDIQKAAKAVKEKEPYLVEGVWVYPSEARLMQDYPHAVRLNKFSPFLEDIINFIKTISVEYFGTAWDQREQMYFVYDIRLPDERRKR
jgi:hypothetical protein